jgi:flagellar basal body P-ring formation protein FlgA
VSARRLLRRLAFFAAAVVAAPAALAGPSGSRIAPVPAQVIYPGDRISESMLTDSTEPVVGAFLDRADLIGKVARRTLLPGRPVPAMAVEEPRALSIGALTQIVYEKDGISIVTTAQALQNGYAGQMVQVRNLDSNIVVTGIVQPDGSVLVNGG